ncbi:sporulation-specific diadenylate cyclase CdaS [Cohnella suwonensis]|uniref:Sporulation-specific diadenylate cyclase CdaS n=1 Tax=Cohnella suwonensis TaxID=696072 RepID=A0ABW0LRV9_9BACL
MAAQSPECDFSPMKELIKQDIRSTMEKLEQLLARLDQDERCTLGEFENIKKNFLDIESRAATFYLNCYLSPFMERYMDLSLAIRSLSGRRHGALIAVERADSTSPFVQPGIPINAPVSHSLLEAIFYPGNPLHDGAVLIRSNLIVSAKHVLPLTSAQGNERITGTRHRAAVGLSEQCDAIVIVIVIVVSEETGNASFAIDGQLYPVITP